MKHFKIGDTVRFKRDWKQIIKDNDYGYKEERLDRIKDKDLKVVRISGNMVHTKPNEDYRFYYNMLEYAKEDNEI